MAIAAKRVKDWRYQPLTATLVSEDDISLAYPWTAETPYPNQIQVPCPWWCRKLLKPLQTVDSQRDSNFETSPGNERGQWVSADDLFDQAVHRETQKSFLHHSGSMPWDTPRFWRMPGDASQ